MFFPMQRSFIACRHVATCHRSCDSLSIGWDVVLSDSLFVNAVSHFFLACCRDSARPFVLRGWLVGSPLDFRHVVLYVLEHASLLEDVWQVQRIQYVTLPQARGCGCDDDLTFYLEIDAWEVAMS